MPRRRSWPAAVSTPADSEPITSPERPAPPRLLAVRVIGTPAGSRVLWRDAGRLWARTRPLPEADAVAAVLPQALTLEQRAPGRWAVTLPPGPVVAAPVLRAFADTAGRVRPVGFPVRTAVGASRGSLVVRLSWRDDGAPVPRTLPRPGGLPWPALVAADDPEAFALAAAFPDQATCERTGARNPRGWQRWRIGFPPGTAPRYAAPSS